LLISSNPPCTEDAYDITGFYASVFYQQQLEDAQNNFIAEYTAHCFGGTFNEHYQVTHTDKEYHYTLYYYDQAGSLVRTVPPAGVKLLNTAQITQVNTYRTLGTGSPVYPAHTRATNTMVTNYKYNSLNQLKASATPDGGTTTFWYDKVGRLLTSQNARQAAVGGAYSYTLYDKQNRPYEVGELGTGTPMTQTIADDYNGQYLSWVNGASVRQQVTKTYYDQPFTAITGIPFQSGQQYLRQRVASVTTEDVFDGNDATYNHATHYSYDVHGNVNELVQDNPELAHLGGQAYSQRFKRMTYSYELVSGNVREVRYQSGEGDMYVHRYAYDADNRVLAAWTSRDGVLWSRDAKYLYYLHGPLGRTELGEKQVQGTDYVFTIQGWIKGVNSNVLDRDKDIGKDGHNVNATNYIASQQGVHSNFGVDAFGFTLDYFWNNATGKRDYKPINVAAQSLYNDAPNATSGVNDLYNGNIKGMAVALQKPNGTALPQNLGLVYNQYKYDQLNRITLHQAYTGTSTTAYASLSNTNEYRNVFSYDANGNIITQLRNGTAASGLSMDNLQYWYYTSTGAAYNPAVATPVNATNKLAYVDDSGTPGNYADDLEDQSAGNYTYDATGQLTGDAAEQIANISWTVYGKIANITRTTGSTKKELTFKYDALGQRVMKLAKSRDASGVMTQENWTYTYYVRDAQGNVMATYKRALTADVATQVATDKLVLEESHIYGSARLGVDDRESENINATNTFAWGGGYDGNGELIPAAVPVQSKMAAVNVLTPKRKLGLKLYELSNHLGNVLVTVSDRKLTKQLGSSASVEFYMADVRSASDYSAFGAALSGRTFSSPSYKYGFNGMEKDAEMHGVDGDSYDFGARMYDARVGRFLSRDRFEIRFAYQSSYIFAGNSPIYAIDIAGDSMYILLYAVGNEDGEDMFKAAALTRQYDIEHSAGFDPKRDKVVLVPITDLALVNQQVKQVTDANSTTYGQTAEVDVYSHGGNDGPGGSVLTTGADKTGDGYQMTPQGWGAINFNWVESGGRLNFFSCNSGADGFTSFPNPHIHNFCLDVSKQSTMKNVTVSGQQSAAYPSEFTNRRSTTLDQAKGIYPKTLSEISASNKTYMVGSTPGTIASGLAVMTVLWANPMNSFKNGVSIGTQYQPGTQRPKP
jgi:RHS repeat-associated protein